MNNAAFRGSGLVARFVYCFPKSNIGTRKYDTEPISEKTAENYKKLVYRLLYDKFSYNSESEMYLHFDKNSYREFVNLYNNHIEPKLITDMAFCKDWGGKYHGLILRLCGIIHCVKCALNGSNPVEKQVDIETFCNAVEIGEYYREQAIYAYSLGDVDTATLKAERVIDRIRAKNIRTIRQNELYKICRCTLFRNANDFNETMIMLEDYGYICRENIKTENSNRSGTMININPHLYKSEF